MKKRIRIKYNSPVVLTFAVICLAVTVLGMVSGGAITQLLFMTYRSSFTNPLTYLRLFTHIFGHSGWEHFIGNAAYLLLLGPMLEEKYGPKVLLMIMAVTALVTALINSLLFAGVGLCGASGVVFAFILLSSFTQFKNGDIPLTFVLVFVIYIGQQILQGIFVQDNISNMAHIVGGLVGAAAGYVWNRKPSPKTVK